MRNEAYQANIVKGSSSIVQFSIGVYVDGIGIFQMTPRGIDNRPFLIIA